jgi:carbonic anhydrase
MCIACSSSMPNYLSSRRRFLSLTAAGIATASVLGARTALATGATTSVTPDEALARLKAGNERYLSAPQICAGDLLRHREDAAKAQAPWATILTCSDSRVPPELLFGGLGVGELFVARNAGNMADTATTGTIEYGVEHLGIPLVVVMGHERCGAVIAACEVVDKHAKFPGSIGLMVDAIVPAAKAVYGMPGDSSTTPYARAPNARLRRSRPRARSFRASSRTIRSKWWPRATIAMTAGSSF